MQQHACNQQTLIQQSGVYGIRREFDEFTTSLEQASVIIILTVLLNFISPKYSYNFAKLFSRQIFVR